MLSRTSSKRFMGCLTVKLRGRPRAPNQAPRAHNLFSARGADIQAVHGPLQRLLEANGFNKINSTSSVRVGCTYIDSLWQRINCCEQQRSGWCEQVKYTK